jgi:hypothetical protein
MLVVLRSVQAPPTPAAPIAVAVVASTDAMLVKALLSLITVVPFTLIAIFVFLHY